MDNEEVERDSGERSGDQLGVYGIDEMTSVSDHNRIMDVVDVEENVNEVSMDEVSVGCDPEYEDYGTPLYYLFPMPSARPSTPNCLMRSDVSRRAGVHSHNAQMFI